MNQHTGELGYPNTDFNFIKSCLDDFKDFDKEPKADEGMRQVVIFFVYKSLNSTYLIFT